MRAATAYELETSETASPDPKRPSASTECPAGTLVLSAHRAGRKRRLLPILLGGVVLLAAYGGVERALTHANAGRVTSYEDYGGGFLAVGMTDTQPGFVLLSGAAAAEVRVSAQQANSFATGTQTSVTIATARGEVTTTLRAPQAFLVSADGEVSRHALNWTAEDFRAVERAADCEHPTPGGRHRCGAPLADLYDVVLARQLETPDAVRAFLKKHADE